MHEIRSLSLFVGTGQCNGNCAHCAGKPLRQYAPKEDGIIDEALIKKTVKECYDQGARSLTISSSGEPTLSPKAVTMTLELVSGMKNISFNRINLYSNGIRIGSDKDFCVSYLPDWKTLGLGSIYVTVHDVDEKNNARIYGIKEYPPLTTVIGRIHDADLQMRANLVLSTSNIASADRFISMVEQLRVLGVDYISAWPIRDLEDKVDKSNSPEESELDKMKDWLRTSNFTDKVRLLRETDRVVYETGQKLTLFPDGKLSNTWCN